MSEDESIGKWAGERANMFKHLHQRWRRVVQNLSKEGSNMTPFGNQSPSCDHSSSGVLVWRGGRLLLIERKRPPYGFAPPSGHVDDHGSFRDAAVAELAEETGLTAVDLRLLTVGRMENTCRRADGTWHYWHIFRARAVGTVALGPTEARSYRWVNNDELAQLANRAEQFILGEIGEAEWQSSPGLEPVWYFWLQRLGFVSEDADGNESNDDKGATNETFEAATEYARNWFQYHAGQRLAVFRFFLILFAVVAAGFGTSWGNGHFEIGAVLAFVLLLFTLYFWRLDERNLQLVKLAERYLAPAEERMLSLLGRPQIRLTVEADKRDRKLLFVRLRMYSFKETYRWIFCTIAVLGVLALAATVFQLTRVPALCPDFAV
jgi:ADP-ribose pyrophosphatase YjhB (NUDIX family)